MRAPMTPGAIAGAFLPSRWHFHYARSKLACDPLYAGATQALAGARGPVLDLGCGIGLLAHCLAACGDAREYHGVDNDAGKIAIASRAAAKAGLARIRFSAIDLAGSVPGHCGSVALLDVLQFVPPQAQPGLIDAAARRVAAGGRLVIRTGLAGTGWRARLTRAADVGARWLRWMNTGPREYPDRVALERRLHEAGLQVTFSPLWGATPFNNWLVVAERPQAVEVDVAGPGSGGSTQR